jgi:hypothetical protein
LWLDKYRYSYCRYIGVIKELLDLILIISNVYYCSGSVEVVVKLAVIARPRLGPACALLRRFAELVTVLIGLFIILISNSRSRLCFDL